MEYKEMFKYRVLVSNELDIFIDKNEIESDENVNELINDSLVNATEPMYVKKLQEIFNPQLETIQLEDIEQFYYDDWKNEKDHNLSLEFIISSGPDFDREELNWLAGELIDVCWDDSNPVYGIEINKTYKTYLNGVEEVK